MVSIESIEFFWKSRNIAVAGISRSGKKFGDSIFKELHSRTINLYPVHPDLESYQNLKCYKAISELPQDTDALIICTNPEHSLQMAKDAFSIGIRNIWFQQGAQTKEASEFCKINGINAISGECVFMFLDKNGFPHNFHRWIWTMIGKIEKTA